MRPPRDGGEYGPAAAQAALRRRDSGGGAITGVAHGLDRRVRTELSRNRRTQTSTTFERGSKSYPHTSEISAAG